MIFFKFQFSLFPNGRLAIFYLQFVLLVQNLFVVDHLVGGHDELRFGVPLMISNVISRNRGVRGGIVLFLILSVRSDDCFQGTGDH